MLGKIEEKDLRKFPKKGYKIALILPKLDDEKLKKCVTYYGNIYKSLASRGQNVFDPINQVITGNIGREEYTFLLVRDYDEQDELLTYLPEYISSLKRLGENAKFDMLKVMPDGNVIDADLVPLCEIKRIAYYDIVRLQTTIHYKMNGVESFDFTLIDNPNSESAKVYYKKTRVRCSLKRDDRNSFREYRCSRAMRIFYDETFRIFGENFYLGNNIQFYDELGGPIPNTAIFSPSKREVVEINGKRNASVCTFTAEDFESVDCPKGYKVLAMKLSTRDSELSYLPRLFSKAFNKVRSFNCETKVAPATVNGQDVVAIYCHEDAFEILNNRLSLVYAYLVENQFYKKDNARFYYRMANDSIMPINYAYLCEADGSNIPSDKKLKSALESQIGNGYDIEIQYNDKGNYDCYAVVDDFAADRAKSQNQFNDKKRAAIREAEKQFGIKNFITKENDGSTLRVKESQMSR